MASLIKDFTSLFTIELPASFSRKRLILNFVLLYAASLSSTLFQKRASVREVEINSHVWKSFSHIIGMYLRYLSPRYLLDTYVIRGAASGWHSKEYVEFLKKNFTEEKAAIIPAEARETVNKVSRIISDEFGLDYDAFNRWLMTYQFGLAHFSDDASIMLDKLKNTRIIELGAGVGANAAVHAALSNKGVYIFDIPPMLEVQKVVHQKLAAKINLSPMSYYDDPDALMADAKGTDYIIVSYWAFTEFPASLREKLDPLLQGAQFSFFACNPLFEGVDNLEYFRNAATRIGGKDVKAEPIEWNPYKKHNYVMVR